MQQKPPHNLRAHQQHRFISHMGYVKAAGHLRFSSTCYHSLCLRLKNSPYVCLETEGKMLWLNVAMALQVFAGMWHVSLLFTFHWPKQNNGLG